ncbi:GAF domain-containing protein [candidate division KSB1 bacterium]|nr:GAF domain-containing protein [candidate division KSB1 bacterium]
MLQAVSNKLLNNSQSISDILDFVLMSFMEKIHYQFGAIVQYNHNKTIVSHYVNQGLPGEIIQQIGKLFPDDFLKLSPDRNKSVYIHQSPGQPGKRLKEFLVLLQENNLKGGLSLLFKTRDNVWGGLHLWREEKIVLNDDDCLQFELLCNILGLSLENHWFQKQNQENFELLEPEHLLLNPILSKINQATDLKSILSETLKDTLEILNLNAGGVYLIDLGAHCAELVTYSGLPGELVPKIEYLQLNIPPVSSVMSAGKTLITVELANFNGEIFSLQRVYGMKRFVSVPLRVRDQIVGFVNLSVPQLRNFNMSEMSFLDSISRQLGLKVEYFRLNERLGNYKVDFPGFLPSQTEVFAEV